jgi:hypothetical protein
VEAEGGALSDVIGFAEAANGREAAEHPPGHGPEPVGHDADELGRPGLPLGGVGGL